MKASEIKQKLVEAHRSGDWEAAKKLSQEKQRLKKIKYCQWPGCGVRLADTSSGDSLREHCVMHSNVSRFYSKSLALCVTTLAVLTCFGAPSPNTVSVTAYFTFPSQPSNFSHYTVYYGTQSSNYMANVVGVSTNLTVPGLARGQTFYFNVTQSTTDGTESDYTTEVSYTTPTKPPKATSLAVQAQ